MKSAARVLARAACVRYFDRDCILGRGLQATNLRLMGRTLTATFTFSDIFDVVEIVCTENTTDIRCV